MSVGTDVSVQIGRASCRERGQVSQPGVDLQIQEEQMQKHGTEQDFYFHAEDGIRGVAVTGVQACALPICATVGGIVVGNTVGGTLVGLVGSAVGGTGDIVLLGRIT